MTDDTLIVGLHAVRTALNHGATAIRELYYDRRRQDQRLQVLLEAVIQTGITAQAVERTALDRLTGGANHQGVAARVLIPAAQDEHKLEQLLDALTVPAFLLILDGVQDPHNLGACLRAADAAGAQAVIAPRDRAVGLTPVVCKVASGAAGQLPYIQVTNLARTLRHIQERGIWLIGAAAEAPTLLYAANLTGPLALLLGGEGAGLRRLTRSHCDHLVSLPMHGVVESLNVAVTAGILLYEALRQRST